MKIKANKLWNEARVYCLQLPHCTKRLLFVNEKHRGKFRIPKRNWPYEERDAGNGWCSWLKKWSMLSSDIQPKGLQKVVTAITFIVIRQGTTSYILEQGQTFVPWNKPVDVTEFWLWSMLSATAVMNWPLWIRGGETVTFSSKHLHTFFLNYAITSIVRSYEADMQSANKPSTSSYLSLVNVWVWSATCIGSGVLRYLLWETCDTFIQSRRPFMQF